ncbi:MAG: phage major capsid protein [Aeromonas veronii]
MQTKIDEVLSVIKSQADEIAEMRDALEAVKSAPVEQVEVKSEDLKAKFYEVVKSGEGTDAQGEIVKEGQIKAMNVTDSASAGAGVVAEVSTQIVQRMVNEFAVPALFGFANTNSTKFERRVQVSGSTVNWEGENLSGTSGDNTDTPTFATIEMTHGKVTAFPQITQEALSDPFFDAEAFVLADVAKEMGRAVADALMNGDGVKKPMGFYRYMDAVEGAKDVKARKVDHFAVLNAAITSDEELIAALRKMIFSMKAGYRAGAKFVMSEELFERVAGLTDGMKRPLMQPSLDAAILGTLFGYGIVVDTHIPADVPVVFGQLDQAFQIVNIPTELSFNRNPYRVRGCVEFEIAQRIGTIVLDNEAVIGLMVPAARKAK